MSYNPSHSHTHILYNHPIINVSGHADLPVCARLLHIIISCTESRPRHSSAYSISANCMRSSGWVGCLKAFILYVSDMTGGVSCLKKDTVGKVNAV